MSRIKALFQALKDCDNPSEVIDHGPYKCTRSDAWLGDGFYFWDSIIDLAHWWGKLAYGDKYIIGKLNYYYDDALIYDLLEPEKLNDFREYADLLRKEYGKSYTVASVLAHMRTHPDFHYRGVRMKGEHSTSSIEGKKIFFKRRNDYYLDTKPAVQICLFHDKDVKSSPFELVYPEKYIAYNIPDMSGTMI